MGRTKGLEVSQTEIGVAAAALAVAGLAYFNITRAKRSERSNPQRGELMRVNGVELHHVESGTSGPVVVLLHGNGTTLEDWFACGVFQELSKTSRVIAFDRPGYGYSTRPRSKVWTPAAQADAVALALKSLGADEVTLVAHSFGTLVGIELALRHPDLVRSIVLMSGYYYPSVRPDVLAASIPAIPVVGDLDRYSVGPILGAALRPILERKLFAPAAVASSWDKFPFGMTLRPSQLRAEAAEAALMIPAAASMAERYKDLSVPIQVISGEGDRVVDHANQSARLAGALPNATLSTFKGVGHMIHHTATDRVIQTIKRSLRDQATISDQE